MPSSKTVAIDTLGCKVNQYDSVLMEECLKQEKFKIVSSKEPADIYIVNSCTVTAKADQEAKILLRRFKEKNPNATLVLTGCFAQTSASELSKLGIHYVVGNTLKQKISELLKEPKSNETNMFVENSFKTIEPLSNIQIHADSAHQTRIFLKIQDGCDDFCTFCIIPYARGKSRSLEPEAVISQINTLVQEGVKEVVLTGVSLGSYGWDLSLKTNLAQLIRKIENETNLLRLRISSLEPEDVSDELLSILKESSKFCPHFHLPIQSGDDAILKRMQRNYSVSYYEKLVTKINKDFKDPFIGIDVICGFPGETKDQFENTFRFLEQLPWSKLHVFPYSPRKGTPAAKFRDQLVRSDILPRSKKLRDLSQKRYLSFLESTLQKSLLSLVEHQESKKRGFYKAISRNYAPIYFKTDNPNLLNQEISLTPFSVQKEELFGKIV